MRTLSLVEWDDNVSESESESVDVKDLLVEFAVEHDLDMLQSSLAVSSCAIFRLVLWIAQNRVLRLYEESGSSTFSGDRDRQL